MKWNQSTALCVINLVFACTLQACNGNLPGNPIVAPSTKTVDPKPAASADTPTVPAADNPPDGTDPITGGASSCEKKEFGLCDGFESPLDTKTWKTLLQNPGDTVEQDTARAARGKGSVHFHTVNGGYERAMITTAAIPKENNSFFGRAFVYIAGPMPQAHFTLFTALGSLPGKPMPTEVRYGGQFGIYIANYIGNDEYKHAGHWENDKWADATVVPTDTWVCMEWQYKGDTNEIHFWQDEMPIASLDVVGASHECCNEAVWQAPPYDTMALGWEIYSNQDKDLKSFDVWMDEVALNKTRIGCSH